TACAVRVAHHHYPISLLYLFFFKHPPPTAIYPLSLHDALPICKAFKVCRGRSTPSIETERAPASSSASLIASAASASTSSVSVRSEEHTSELQSHLNLVCRLLLEKKKIHTHEDHGFTQIT